MKCDGCGKDVQCARFGPKGAQVWLGYTCGCYSAWDKAMEGGESWGDVKPWAESRRKQVAP